MKLVLLLSASILLLVSAGGPPFEAKFNYCPCGIVDGKFDGWDPKKIWIDIVIIFDVSASMGESLEEAKSMVTNFISYLNTDVNAKFYSRIGVITAADKAKDIYKLNMNATDSLDMVQLIADAGANLEKAMKKVTKMFDDAYLTSHYAQKLVYYLTKTTPTGKDTGELDYFLGEGGMLMINDFSGIPNPDLSKLATPNFYFTDLSKNVAGNLGVFCEANCYCNSDNADEFNDDEISVRTRANRGCFQLISYQNYSSAVEYCPRWFSPPAALVSIHDEAKEFFVNSVTAFTLGNKHKYWIGLQNNGTSWNWEDESTDPFSDWDVGQPDTNEGQKMCASADKTTGFNVKWSATDCGEVLNMVCEYMPMSVGFNGD